MGKYATDAGLGGELCRYLEVFEAALLKLDVGVGRVHEEIAVAGADAAVAFHDCGAGVVERWGLFDGIDKGAAVAGGVVYIGAPRFSMCVWGGGGSGVYGLGGKWDIHVAEGASAAGGLGREKSDSVSEVDILTVVQRTSC